MTISESTRELHGKVTTYYVSQSTGGRAETQGFLCPILSTSSASLTVTNSGNHKASCTRIGMEALGRARTRNYIHRLAGSGGLSRQMVSGQRPRPASIVVADFQHRSIMLRLSGQEVAGTMCRR